jgi:hypothetical protein
MSIELQVGKQYCLTLFDQGLLYGPRYCTRLGRKLRTRTIRKRIGYKRIMEEKVKRTSEGGDKKEEEHEEEGKKLLSLCNSRFSYP